MRIEKRVCDICGADNANQYEIPTYRTFDSCDGRTKYRTPHLAVEELDLCDKCALASTNIHSVGVMDKEFTIDEKPLCPEEVKREIMALCKIAGHGMYGYFELELTEEEYKRFETMGKDEQKQFLIDNSILHIGSENYKDSEIEIKEIYIA